MNGVKMVATVAVAIVTCNICRWSWTAVWWQGAEFGEERRRVPSYPVSASVEWRSGIMENGGMESCGVEYGNGVWNHVE